MFFLRLYLCVVSMYCGFQTSKMVSQENINTQNIYLIEHVTNGNDIRAIDEALKYRKYTCRHFCLFEAFEISNLIINLNDLAVTILLPFEDVSKNYQYSIKNNDISNNFIYTGYIEGLNLSPLSVSSVNVDLIANKVTIKKDKSFFSLLALDTSIQKQYKHDSSKDLTISFLTFILLVGIILGLFKVNKNISANKSNEIGV